MPFQFGLHHHDPDGPPAHDGFLDLSGGDPRRALAESLVEACDGDGTVFAYNAGFERRVMRGLADLFPAHAEALRGIIARVADLLPIARNHYYHPDQHGSWSLKAVLPTLRPDPDYGALNGVRDGRLAREAFLEAVNPDTPCERREEIRRQLLAYCELEHPGAGADVGGVPGVMHVAVSPRRIKVVAILRR